MNTMNTILTPKDIAPKHVTTDSSPNNQNKIRKAWTMILDEKTKNAIKTKIETPEARWAYYKSIDDAVNDAWLQMMREHVDNAIKQGAKMVQTKNGERLEDAYCVNADYQLIQAAQKVAEEIIAEFA